MILDADRIAELCEAHDIGLLRLFGSAVRGEERGDSDVDLLVRFTKRKTLLDLIGIEEEFERVLGRKVDSLPKPLSVPTSVIRSSAKPACSMSAPPDSVYLRHILEAITWN